MPTTANVTALTRPCRGCGIGIRRTSRDRLCPTCAAWAVALEHLLAAREALRRARGLQ